jgi:hypothetical protein
MATKKPMHVGNEKTERDFGSVKRLKNKLRGG